MRRITQYAICTLAMAALSGFAAAPAAAQPAGPQGATVRVAAAVDYTVRVTTGDVQSAGTDSSVWVRLHGTRGTSEFLYLDNAANNFERAKTDTFRFTLSDLGRITSVDVRFKRSGDNPGWYLDKITIPGAGESRVFPYYGWITWNSTVSIAAA